MGNIIASRKFWKKEPYTFMHLPTMGEFSGYICRNHGKGKGSKGIMPAFAMLAAAFETRTQKLILSEFDFLRETRAGRERVANHLEIFASINLLKKVDGEYFVNPWYAYVDYDVHLKMRKDFVKPVPPS